MSYRDHIVHITKDKDHFWCHREKTQFDWAYVDLEHALVSKDRDWIQPCKQCLKKAIAASQGQNQENLTEHTQDESSR